MRTASGTLAVVLVLTLGTPWAVRAQDLDQPTEAAGEDLGDVERWSDDSIAADGLGDARPELAERIADSASEALPAGGVDPSSLVPPADPVPLSLPGGEDRSAVTPQSISLPQAEGSIQGMGESFSPVLSSGTGTFSVPIAVPNGRAGVQPSFALAYGTSGGNGHVGFGWSVGAPFISRQTDRGLPHYVDRAGWHAEEDRFIYNGGQELVPVDNDDIATVDDQAMFGQGPTTYGVGALPDGVDTGWQQYRARVEGGFMRFFRSPSSDRWVVQSKDGTRFDFGVLYAGDGPTGIENDSLAALQSENDDGSGRVFMWLLTRMSDAHGSAVYYRYLADAGDRYLSDVHYVSPAACASSMPSSARACSEPLSDYGARVSFDYETRGDVFTSYVSGWRVATSKRLSRITVTAAADSAGTRYLVRRYHLGYDPDSYHSLLTSVQVEGRPSVPHVNVDAYVGDTSVSESSLTAAIVGELLPPMTFTYTAQPSGAGIGRGVRRSQRNADGRGVQPAALGRREPGGPLRRQLGRPARPRRHRPGAVPHR